VNPFTKLLLAGAALIVGLEVYGRWTGKSGSFSFTGPNGLGAAINQAAAASTTANIANPGGQGGGAAEMAGSFRDAQLDTGGNPASAINAATAVLPGRAAVGQVIG